MSSTELLCDGTTLTWDGTTLKYPNEEYPATYDGANTLTWGNGVLWIRQGVQLKTCK